MEPAQPQEHVKSELIQLCHRIYRKLDANDRLQSIASYKKHYGDGYSDCVLYTSNLTGMHPHVLEQLKDDSQEMKISSEEMDRAIILKELTDFYLNKQIMPTTRDLFDALQGKLPFHMDIASFRKHLALMDFMWKNVQNRFFVIERPEVSYERYKFLKLVLEYHENNRPIYFIEELVYAVKNFFTKSTGQKAYRPKDPANVVYALSKKGALYKSVPEYCGKEFNNFLCDVLIPNLKEHSLIVIKNKNYCSEKAVLFNPTFASTIRDMKEWLDRNYVPYDDGMSKGELYSLIQKCTNKDQNTYFADSIIKAHGHNAVRIPASIEQLAPTTFFFELVQDTFVDFNDEKLSAQGVMFQIFNTIDEQRLAHMYEGVMDEYKSLLQNDIKVDDVLDSLIAKMATRNVEGAEDSDIPSDGEV
ncbi:unnamed protein product [Chilo suppressalis]|uniref:Uncharacterized protein n=1 Tax=Chilo suppressalis TaxID=168631 RepID=A0ABN8B8R8_CHISP|nr:unnamed protein product [Chilo suppressalis]